MKLMIFSFFSGSGFLDLGFEKAGYNIKFVNELSESFLDAYKHSREKMGFDEPEYGYNNTDINDYLNGRKEELNEYISSSKKNNGVIGFIGGPPCPDFSVGGKNKGKHGENGKLSLSYINLIVDVQPDFFLFENVKGLWRTKRHREFYNQLKRKLQRAGYVTTERLTNALEFGVPQDRDRILLFGVKSSLLPKDNVKGKEIINFPWEKNAIYSLKEIKEMEWPETNGFTEEPGDDHKILDELTVQYWFNKNDVSNHANSNAYFKPRQGLSKMETISEGDVSKKSYKRLHRKRYSPTVAYGNNEVHLHPYEARRLSAAEALAIQSLPKEFELPKDMTLSNMFKTIGNGVPYLLSLGIAKTIKEYLEDKLCKE